MKSNYDLLGNHIRLIDNRNKDLVTEQVLGINIDKFFMPSVFIHSDILSSPICFIIDLKQI